MGNLKFSMSPPMNQYVQKVHITDKSVIIPWDGQL